MGSLRAMPTWAAVGIGHADGMSLHEYMVNKRPGGRFSCAKLRPVYEEWLVHMKVQGPSNKAGGCKCVLPYQWREKQGNLTLAGPFK